MAAVFITYGGFDEKRYLGTLIKALEKKGLIVRQLNKHRGIMLRRTSLGDTGA